MMASSKNDDAQPDDMPQLELGLKFEVPDPEASLDATETDRGGTAIDRVIDFMLPSSDNLVKEGRNLDNQVKEIENRVNHVEDKVNAVHEKVEEITSQADTAISVPTPSLSPTPEKTDSSFKSTRELCQPEKTVHDLTEELANFL